MTPVSSMVSVVIGSVIGSIAAAGLKAGAHRLEFSIKGLLSNWQLIAGGFAIFAFDGVLRTRIAPRRIERAVSDGFVRVHMQHVVVEDIFQ